MQTCTTPFHIRSLTNILNEWEMAQNGIQWLRQMQSLHFQNFSHVIYPWTSRLLSSLTKQLWYTNTLNEPRRKRSGCSYCAWARCSCIILYITVASTKKNFSSHLKYWPVGNVREGKRCRHGEVAEDGAVGGRRGVRVREDTWMYGKRMIKEEKNSGEGGKV